MIGRAAFALLIVAAMVGCGDGNPSTDAAPRISSPTATATADPKAATAIEGPILPSSPIGRYDLESIERTPASTATGTR
jgi:hypothetical protein